jgi:hypothetical protein
MAEIDDLTPPDPAPEPADGPLVAGQIFGPRLRPPPVVAAQALQLLQARGLPQQFVFDQQSFRRVAEILVGFGQERGQPNGAAEIVSLARPVA